MDDDSKVRMIDAKGDIGITPEEEKAQSVIRISVSDLITKCNVTASKMSKRNPNRLLIINCAFAMRQMVDHIDAITPKQVS